MKNQDRLGVAPPAARLCAVIRARVLPEAHRRRAESAECVPLARQAHSATKQIRAQHRVVCARYDGAFLLNGDPDVPSQSSDQSTVDGTTAKRRAAPM